MSPSSSGTSCTKQLLLSDFTAEDDSNSKHIQAVNDSKKEGTTPYEVYFETRTDYLITHNLDILGVQIIKGVDRADDEEEEEEDTSKYTTEQMNSMRVIMVTENREKQHDEMRKLILGDAWDDDMLTFTSSFSYKVMDSWYFVNRHFLPRCKTPSQKLDLLMMYTSTLKEFPWWMHYNKGGLGVVVKGLGNAWKTLLKNNSDKDLGWDNEYTKPGVMELLNQFRAIIDNVPDYRGLGKFKYM